MRSLLCVFLAFLAYVTAYDCPSGYSSGSYVVNNTYTQYCYRVYITFYNREQAASQCRKDGATLATIPNDAVNNMLVNADQVSGSLAIGLHCINTNDCVYDDGTPFTSTSYNKFIGGGPNVNYGECVALETLGALTGQWNSVPCSTLGAFVCQYNPNSYVTQQSGCNSLVLLGPISGYTMRITSPHYPNNYDNYQTCSYFLQATIGRGINITFTDFYTENCCDKVRLYSGGIRNNVTSIGTYSGLLTGFSVLVQGTEAMITFTSDDSNIYRGFAATVRYYS